MSVLTRNIATLADYLHRHTRRARPFRLKDWPLPPDDTPKSIDGHMADAKRLLPQFIENIKKGLVANMGLVLNVPHDSGDVRPRQPVLNTAPKRPSPTRSIESAPLVNAEESPMPGWPGIGLPHARDYGWEDPGSIGGICVGHPTTCPVVDNSRPRPLGLPDWGPECPQFAGEVVSQFPRNASALVGAEYGDPDVSPGRTIHSVYQDALEDAPDSDDDGEELVETDVPQERIVNVPPKPLLPMSKAQEAQLRLGIPTDPMAARNEWVRDTRTGTPGQYSFPRSSGVPAGGYDE